jgi:Fe-S oxidoreductase
MKPLIFGLLMVSALGLLTWTISRLVKFMAVGRPDIKLDRLPERFISVLVYWLMQKKVPEPTMDGAKPGFTSKHHLIIFWGFLIITIGTVEMYFNGLTGLDFSFIGGPLYSALKVTIDVFNLLVLFAIGFGYFRRVVVKPRLIPMSLDAGIILGAIAGLMITHFAFHGFRLVSVGELESAAPVSSVVAGWFMGMNPERARTVSEAMWWAHIVLGFAFLNYVPYSKHIHILGSLPNIFFRNLGQRGAMPKLNLEDENDWGVGKIEQFTQKSLMDQYACTECGRCSNYCPAFNTDKPLSPMHLIHDLRDEMIERGTLQMKIAKLEGQLALDPASAHNGHGNGHADPHGPSGHGDEHSEAASGNPLGAMLNAAKKAYDDLPPMVGGRIKDETLWACTTCGACQEVCPVFIDHPLKILQMRTHLVLTESRMPAELARTFTNLEKNSNPWGIAAEKRMEWAEGLEVPTIDTTPNAEYLLFVGCAGAFDDRIKKTMRALVEVLHAAEVSFAVLGESEQCSGDPARRAGNEYLFQSQAEANVTAINDAGIRKVIASCPHCFHTIKNEYPQIGGEYEVIHHSQLLAHLIAEGRLTPQKTVAKSYTYHDSCYLGRWNGEYAAPRQILEAVSGVNEASGGVIELGRNKEHGFCCGGGGGRMWMEEKIGTRVNNNRADEIIASGAEVAAVACPFCTIMITDGVKAANAEERIQILDVAEVIAKSLPNRAKKPLPVPKPPEEVAASEQAE